MLQARDRERSISTGAWDGLEFWFLVVISCYYSDYDQSK